MLLVSKERVGAISDGMIAVAATVLVLELKVPEGVVISDGLVLHWTRLIVAWLISFAMIGIVWFDNHLFLLHARNWNARLTVVTFAQLAAVSLIPFISDLAIDNFRDLASIIAFNCVMLSNGLISVVLGRMVAANVAAEAPSNEKSGQLAVQLRRRSMVQLRIALTIFGIAIFGAWLHHPFLGLVLWGASPLLMAKFMRSNI